MLTQFICTSNGVPAQAGNALHCRALIAMLRTFR
jgi:hypothetical protein